MSEEVPVLVGNEEVNRYARRLEAEVERLRAAWDEDQTMVERDNERLSAENERLQSLRRCGCGGCPAAEHYRPRSRTSIAPVDTSDGA